MKDLIFALNKNHSSLTCIYPVVGLQVFLWKVLFEHIIWISLGYFEAINVIKVKAKLLKAVQQCNNRWWLTAIIVVKIQRCAHIDQYCHGRRLEVETELFKVVNEVVHPKNRTAD